MNVIEGRAAIVEEVGAGDTALRAYPAAQCATIVAVPDLRNALTEPVAFDELHRQQLVAVIQGMAEIAAMDDDGEGVGVDPDPHGSGVATAADDTVNPPACSLRRLRSQRAGRGAAG